MRKFFLTIGIMLALVLFAAADFYINDLKPKIPAKITQVVEMGKKTEVAMAKDAPEKIDSLFTVSQAIDGYKVIRQDEVNQLFDKINLSTVKNIKIFKNRLGAIEGKDESVYLYEVHGPAGQGSLTYLAVKLKFIAQMEAQTETLNETGEYGDNSFYFNDSNFNNTAFILVQIGDNLFGFQYKKEPAKTFDSVKGIIGTLINS